MEKFIDFYNKYNPIGIRFYDGCDLYIQSKEVYDNIISGNVYVDEVLTDPDNPLRNILKLLFIDIWKFKDK